jgi:hypothetical protein
MIFIPILLVLAILATVVGSIAGLWYPSTCTALENHLKSPLPQHAEDPDGYGQWYKRRWALDKKRTRVALWGIGAYALGMFSLIPVQTAFKHAEAGSHLPLILMLILTAAELTIGIRSVSHNGREFELDMKRKYPYADRF